MKHLTNISLFFLISTFSASAQFGIKVYSGLGSYDMSMQKSLHRSMINYYSYELGTNLKMEENFPAYWNFSGEMIYDFKSGIRLSAGYLYQSAGARAWTGDNTGYMTIDVLTIAQGPNLGFSYHLFYGFVDIHTQLKGMLLFAKNENVFELVIAGEDPEKDKLKFDSSTNFGFEPSVMISKRLKQFETSLSAGYYFDLLRAELTTESGNEIYVPNSNHRLKNEWNGIRVYLGLGYFF